MLLSTLLAIDAATQFPLLTGLLKELWLGLTLFIGAILTVYKIRLDKRAAVKKAKEEAAAREKAALAASIKEMKEEIHHNTLKHTASQQERERLMDAYNTRNQHIETTTNTRFMAVEHKMSQVDTVVTKVNAIETRQEVQSTLMKSMEAQLTDMKSTSKQQFEYIIELLKKGPNK